MKNDEKIVGRKGVFGIFTDNNELNEKIFTFVIDLREVIDLHNEVIIEKTQSGASYYFFLKEELTAAIDEYLRTIAEKYNLEYSAI